MLTYQEGALCLQGVSLEKLAGELPTPFILVSATQLRDNFNAIARGLAASGLASTVRYCAKANSEAGVLAIIAASDSHVLVTHPAEAELVRRCGFPAERIAYQRPVVTEDDIRAVLYAGVTFVHALRPSDLQVIEKVAAESGTRVRVALRLRNDARRDRWSPFGVLARRLGMGDAEVTDAAREIGASRFMTLAGLNFYVGTQQASVASFVPLVRRAVRLAALLRSALGACPLEINLGGGIPSPSLYRLGLGTLQLRRTVAGLPSHDAAAVEQFAARLAAEVREAAEQAGLEPAPSVVVESGRAIVGNAAILVTRVRAVQGRWLFLDASHNVLGESPLLFTRHVVPVVQPTDNQRRYYHLSGSTMNVMDVIDWWRRLPPLGIGDVLALCDAGAYSISRASRSAGLSPSVYMIQPDGRVELIRRAETVDEMSATMTLLNRSR